VEDRHHAIVDIARELPSEEDERLVREGAQRHLGRSAETVVGRERDLESLDADVFEAQAGKQAPPDVAHIEFAIDEAFELDERGKDLERDVDLGVVLPEASEMGGQGSLQDAEDRSNADDTDLSLGGEPGATQCLFSIGEDLARRDEQCAAGVGELDVTGRPDQELNPDLALEALDLAPEPRLRHPKAFRCSREMELLGDGDERPQLVELEYIRAHWA
jgi:hypothetical protein